MTALVLDHLWQSTLFAGVAGLLVLALHENGARVRYYLWFAASLKFLIPFAALAAAGKYLLAFVMLPVSAPPLLALQPMAQPFSANTLIFTPLPAAGPDIAAMAVPLLLALWGIGSFILVARWLRRWSRLQRVVQGAENVALASPLPVKMAASMLEPGLVGIFRPVILLPQGIDARLSRDEMDAILAHELCHMRRRDNLLAATHMLVEALCWFHPLVWWLGAKLNAERERACDESVLAAGLEPHTYAQSILKVCQFYLHSPLDCAAGVSGADLKRRMETIMENRFSLRLSAGRKLLLASCAVIAVAAPVAAGLLAVAPTPATAQANAPRRETAVALRRLLDGRHDGKLPYEIIGNQLAENVRQGRSSLGEHEYEMRALGAVTSVTFKSVEEGMDAYDVTFEHGRMTWLVAPLQNGKVERIFIGGILIDQPAHPGTEAAARRYLTMLAGNQPDFGQMDLMMAERWKEESPQWLDRARQLGGLRSLAFKGGAIRGSDIYAATFANGKADVWISLSAEGKMLADLLPGG